MTRPLATAVPDEPEIRAIDVSLMVKVFYVFAVLGLASLAISLGGQWFGRSIAMGGHSEDPSIRNVIIGDDVIAVPANAIRFEQARRSGAAKRLDLYLRWPLMDGYSETARDDFNHAAGTRRIIFVSFEERSMSRDMSGRFAPIYGKLIAEPGRAGPNGITFYAFTETSGYLNEVLAVAESQGQAPFVARCLSGPDAEDAFAPCERDIHVGKDLSLSYRFPRELLEPWPALEASVRAAATRLLKTGS